MRTTRIVDVANYGHAEHLNLQDVLARPLFAHLATLCPAGPRESPVWFLWEDDAIWIIANEKDSFWKRIESDGRCAIGIVDFEAATGLVHHVGMRGRASVLPWEPQRAVALLTRYLGDDESRWDERFRATVADFTNRWIRFIPVSIVVRDQGYRV